VRRLSLVATNPGISITEIANLVGIAQSSATRVIVVLAEQSPHHRAEQAKRGEALGYIELYQDHHDARKTLCRLTKRGEAFWATLEFIVGK
jgi:DNA-binding MarR family transcriptional regulator